MHDAIQIYFAGEKQAGMMIAGVGTAMLVAAIVLMPARYELRAFAITLAVWGVLELAIGVGLYLKTDPQVATLLGGLGNDGAAALRTEHGRMTIVQRNFVYIEYVELTVSIGAVLVAAFLKTRLTPSGIALGLAINVAVLLAFDIIAERRGATYLAALDAARG